MLPTGEIVADPARGLLMGNRGRIHREDRTLGPARWRTKMWISCVLDWYGERDVMPPGRWTALFFLDEATALAAGTAPAATAAEPITWLRRGLERPPGWPSGCGRGRWTPCCTPSASTAAAASSPARPGRRPPDGAMVRHDGVTGLLTGGRVLPWSFEGYLADPILVEPGTSVELLTPPSSVAAITAATAPCSTPPPARPDHAVGQGLPRHVKPHQQHSQHQPRALRPSTSANVMVVALTSLQRRSKYLLVSRVGMRNVLLL